jgi:hypothetical protein
MSDATIGLIERFARDRWLAHTLLFANRHPIDSAPAHRHLVEAIYSPYARVLVEGFRGLAKSTYLEEAAVLRACYREFHNMVIVGSSYTRACDRLAAVKREFEINGELREVYRIERGSTWQEGKIVLSNGVCIQALGRDQAMTGMKHLDWRPDSALIDDVEDPEEVRTDTEREQTWNWFMKTFLPSLDHPLATWVRVLGTRRGSGSLPERLEKEKWRSIKLPIEHVGEAGERVATWPAKFPLEAIDEIRHAYRGDMHTYMQEFMCQASSEEERIFSRDMLRCEPRPLPSHQAVYAMYDPARTAHQGSATTGKAVWSWFGPRLVFWEIGAETWLPDQIIADMFKTQRRYPGLVWLGFEEDGLNEWAKQPIRAEMVKRGRMLPLLPVKAPRGKTSFIAAMQPYFRAGEVTFAGNSGEFKDAIDQFLSFPRGKIDAPNACAYSLALRPGVPVFDNFNDENVVDDLEPSPGSPLYLAGNADGSVVAAALVQRAEGGVRILADWVREGRPDEVVSSIHAEARLAAETGQFQDRLIYGEGEDELKLPVRRSEYVRTKLRWIVPAWHRDTYRNVGLVQAIRAMPADVSVGEAGAPMGQAALAELMGQMHRGQPRLQVGTAASWTLRALSGGYAKPLSNRALAAAQPDTGLYRLLMEGIETFAALGAKTEGREDEDQQPIAYDRRGVAYRSAMPAPRERR